MRGVWKVKGYCLSKDGTPLTHPGRRSRHDFFGIRIDRCPCCGAPMALTPTKTPLDSLPLSCPSVETQIKPSRVSQPQHEATRRSISISIASLLLLSFPPSPKAKVARADGVFDKYVKKKRLEPLEVYVPPVILTQSQIRELGKTLEGDQPQYASYRSLLRSGPAASLRVNIRAVAQYASESGQGKAATDDVDQCLRALEDLDSLFLRASRNDRQASVELMKGKIFIALSALDSLLQKVPSAVLDKGKAIADAYNDSENNVPERLDPEMQKLESLL